LVAGDQVRVNHLIRLQQPLSKPTNEPIHKPTKQMDLDVKLPNNLSPTKTQVAYSEPKQDAELPIKVNDSTNTQTCGLCHDKKSEPESLAEQSIAATDSSQNILPAGLGLHLAKLTLSMALDPSGSFITLPMTLDLLESFTTPAALDPSANSLLPAALDLSARVNISSIHSKEKLQKPSNLSAGLGLHSASTTNLSAVLDLHSTSCFKANANLHAKTASKASVKMQVLANSNKMPSIFQLIVGSKQMYRRKPQQDLVDSSLSKTIIANFPSSKSSLQSAPNSLLERNDKFIVVSKSRAPEKSVSNKDFQLVVNSKLILNSEGAHAVTITSYSVYEGGQRHSSGDATETNGIDFGESVSHRVDEKNEFRVDYVGNNPFQQTNLPLIVDNSSKFQLIVKSISIPSYEGAQRTASKLIVICAFDHNELMKLILASDHQPNSKISLIFGEEFRTFCEGVKATAKPNGVRHNDLVNLVSLIGLDSLVGHIGLGDLGPTSFVGSSALSAPQLIGHITPFKLGRLIVKYPTLIVRINGLNRHITALMALLVSSVVVSSALSTVLVLFFAMATLVSLASLGLLGSLGSDTSLISSTLTASSSKSASTTTS
jgi:hypothetical protein